MRYWLHRNATWMLIYASFVVTELHRIWHCSTRIENWIWARPTPMLVQWNVKYATDQAVFIMIAAAMFFYGQHPSKTNGKAVVIYLIWTIFDALVYFYNYKTFLYWQMYVVLGFIIAVMYVGPKLIGYIWSTLKQFGR